jgi:hypothetical protein
MTNGSELQAESTSGDLNKDKGFMSRVHVRNTFLELEDDPWMVGATSDLRRQQTDSILHRNSSLKDELVRVMFKAEESQLLEFPTVPMTMDVDQRAFARSEEEAEDAEEGGESAESVDQNDPKVSAEIQAMRDIAANGGGLSGCTTVMMRQIPPKYTQRKLLREINSSGFMGQYDFIYLPMDPRSHANRGFAFINLVSVEVAEEFYKKFHCQYLRNFSAEKAVSVLPADLQGFEENAAQYAATVGHRGRRTGHTKPIFFRTLPSHIAAKLDENRLSGSDDQRQSAPKTNRIPERPRSDPNAQDMAVMLQQALLPAMMNANWQSLIPQSEPSAKKRTPCFCVYCGKQRLPEHFFCPYCGNGFND